MLKGGWEEVSIILKKYLESHSLFSVSSCHLPYDMIGQIIYVWIQNHLNPNQLARFLSKKYFTINVIGKFHISIKILTIFTSRDLRNKFDESL